MDLQRETWGESFTEAVPATILKVAQKVGGITAGAFDGSELIGFVFGISGVEDGKPVHWSDMLAVRESYRNQGIGEKLKLFQKDTLLSQGVDRIYWSFDPLEAKNAHINFNHLGVYVREFVVDMYGNTSSPLHATGTDRLIAIWDLKRTARTQVVDERIPVPANIHETGSEDARKWRERTRAAFSRMLPAYVVTGFERGEKESYYALTSASNFAT